MTDTPRREPTTTAGPAPNGAVVAALLAAGIGAFAMGLVVLLNEAGIFTPPSVHTGAGGVSGRTTLASVVWLAAWVMLHRRWHGRDIEPGRVYALTLLLIGVGVVATFPPVWQLF